MQILNIWLHLEPVLLIMALWLHLSVAQAGDDSSEGWGRPLSVTTNQGRVTESYADGAITIQYQEITNDVPVIEAFSTNGTRVFGCELLSSQLKQSPKWDPETGAPPLSPSRAESIALQRAFIDFGGSIYGLGMDVEPRHHWAVVSVSLVRAWGWWDHQYVWYYNVGVKRLAAGSSPGAADAEIFVTMDGRAAAYVEKKAKRSENK